MVLDNKANNVPVRWYHKPLTIIIAIAGVGPFALPLIWLSPALKKWHKVTLSAVTIILTLWTIKASIDLYQILLREMRNLQAVM